MPRALVTVFHRYIQLLADTAAKYAQHAGRTTLTTTDALEALDDLGFGLQDLIDYVPEAKDLSHYAIYLGRCVEELNKFKAQLGRDEEEEIELKVEAEPPQKRPQTLNWDGHIPDFLSPFPTIADAPESPRAESPQPLIPLLPPTAASAPPPVSQLQLAATSTFAANFVLQVPYEASSLADVSQWHLPGPPPRPPLPAAPNATTTAVAQALKPKLALYKAFHHILTNPTREPTAPSPARHHSSPTPCTLPPRPPCAWPIFPTFAVPASLPPTAATEITPPTRRFPPIHHTVAAPSQITPLMGSQESRLPELAHRILLPAVYAHVTHLAHPPVKYRFPIGIRRKTEIRLGDELVRCALLYAWCPISEEDSEEDGVREEEYRAD
ncbi:hypothetical protein B0H14DRAFT_3738616 [Mycena olivaceomarginata]|nr:hypothetical protein B0H14DRAFT_3738616 [Mycena olivaceomarginata]